MGSRGDQNLILRVPERPRGNVHGLLEGSPPGDRRDPGRHNRARVSRATLRGVRLSPEGFERVSQRLLREFGFERVLVTERSGDGGIDGHGILQVNPFVSFTVLFQCKRYLGAVSAGCGDRRGLAGQSGGKRACLDRQADRLVKRGVVRVLSVKPYQTTPICPYIKSCKH